MAVIRLEDKAEEQSTYAVKAEFFDHDGTAVTPTTVQWTLKDSLHNDVINERSAVSVTPASLIYIVMSGDDLALTAEEEAGLLPGERFLSIYAVYNSVDLGNSLPLRKECVFEIENEGNV